MVCKFRPLLQRLFSGIHPNTYFYSVFQQFSKVIFEAQDPNLIVSNLTTGLSVFCLHFLAKIRIFGGQVTDNRVDKTLTIKMLSHVVFCSRLQMVSGFRIRLRKFEPKHVDKLLTTKKANGGQNNDSQSYIYAVKLKAGPIFAPFKVNNWSTVFFLIVLKSHSPCRKKRIFEKQQQAKKKNNNNKNTISKVKNWSN